MRYTLGEGSKEKRDERVKRLQGQEIIFFRFEHLERVLGDPYEATCNLLLGPSDGENPVDRRQTFGTRSTRNKLLPTKMVLALIQANTAHQKL